jgi:carbon starvation protein
MNAAPLIIGAIAIFVLAYRLYYSWIAAKVLTIKEIQNMPANRLYDGRDYYPMSKWVTFGHHFAAIAGAGPLVGPVLAAQFGYFPGFLWMVVGSVMAGAVHDLVILVASVQHDGKSLAHIAQAEISKVSGVIASLAILIILIIALAGMGLVVVNALAESSWGTFTILDVPFPQRQNRRGDGYWSHSSQPFCHLRKIYSGFRFCRLVHF